MPDYSIDDDSSAPRYEQLRARVVALVAAGELIVGSKLPPVRAMAERRGLAATRWRVALVAAALGR